MIRNLANQVIGGQVINASTGAAFAGTVTVYITGDGGVQAIGSVGSGVCTAEGNGYYSYVPTAAETNYSLVAFTFIGSGAIPATTQVATVTSAQAAALATTSTSGITLKASRLITTALKMLGVIAGTEVPTPDQAQDGLDRLNRLVDSWNIQRGTIQGIQRFTYALVAGQGGPTNPYLIGTGLQFNQACPVWIDNAAILYGSGSTQIELPLYVCLTPDEYTALTQKNITSPIPTIAYYAGVGSGELFLWPVASSASQSIALYVPVAVQQFSDYNTTAYTLSPGYQKALETNLALELAPEYPRGQVDPLLMKMAAESLAYIKRANLDPGLLQCDSALLSNGGGYGPGTGNWLSGP